MPTYLPPNKPLDLIIFDCDGTLSSLEGIDFLAKLKQKEAQVRNITNRAMNEGLMNLKVFEDRLAHVQPTLDDMAKLSEAYYQCRTVNIKEVCQALLELGKHIFIASAGMQQAVEAFGVKLGLAKQHTFAINLHFDAQGHFKNIDHHSPFVRLDGKQQVIDQARTQYQNIGMIGDGANDFSVAHAVDRFIGFGGHYPRHHFKPFCQHYLLSNNAATLLPLLLTKEEMNDIPKQYADLAAEGLALLRHNNQLHYEPNWSPMPHDQAGTPS